MDKLRKLQAEKEQREAEAKLQAEKEEREAKLQAEERLKDGGNEDTVRVGKYTSTGRSAK